MKKLLSQLYKYLMRLRNRLFDWGVINQYRSALPIISVGNISVGGTGKTPLVVSLVSLLQKNSLSPVILSRGYGGNDSGPRLLEKNDPPQEVGDEPLMLQKRLGVPVVIARKRVFGAQYIEKNALGNVILLDDGLQHRYLGRSINIVLIPADSEERVNDVIQDRVLPDGRLRESRYDAISRADVIIFSLRTIEKKSIFEKLLPLIPESIPCFVSSISTAKVLNNNGALVSPQPVHLVSGIAHPEAFAETLSSLGFKILSHEAYGDHHSFPKTSIERIRSLSSQAPVVCTEKDWVKLSSIKGIELFRCIIETEIIPVRTPLGFEEFIMKGIS